MLKHTQVNISVYIHLLNDTLQTERLILKTYETYCYTSTTEMYYISMRLCFSSRVCTTFISVCIQGKQLMDSQRCVEGTEIQRLQKLVDAHSQEMENLRREISLISSFGSHILPRHCP